jgi:hypothetical protein
MSKQLTEHRLLRLVVKAVVCYLIVSLFTLESGCQIVRAVTSSGDPSSEAPSAPSTPREEDEKVLASTRWVQGTLSSVYGSPLVSHPSCLGAVHTAGAYGEEQTLIRDIVAKGSNGGAPATLIVEAIDYGYPYHNKAREGSDISSGFLSVDGYPVPIYESTHVFSRLNQSAHSVLFGWESVFYLATETRNINSQRINGWVHSTDGQRNCYAVVEKVQGFDVVVVNDKTCGLWFAVGSTPQNEVGMDASAIVPVEGPIEASTGSINGSSCFYAIGCEPLPVSAETLICFAVGVSKEEVVAKVAGALANGWEQPLEQAKGYWRSFFSGLREKWSAVPPELRIKGYIALGQLAACTYAPDSRGSFLSAGPGVWHGDFIRDAGWAVKALSGVKPDLAASILEWFAGMPGTLYMHNSFGIDGKEPGAFYNTDNAAVWLLGLGEYYERTKDGVRVRELRACLESGLRYAQENYVERDGHIIARHSHDFADDDYSPLPAETTLYESMVDILWVAALEKVRPVLEDLGDTSNAEFCRKTASCLRVHLSDFRQPDGRLSHSLSREGRLQDSAWWYPSYLYGAWLLGDEESWAWCSKSAGVLGVRDSPIGYGLAIAAVPGEPLRKESWGPFIGIVALLASKHGDFAPVSFLAKAFPSGAFPEFWYMAQVEGGIKPSHYTHATSFPWSYASILELVEWLAENPAIASTLAAHLR